MFDCMHCFLQTPILEHFTTNATIGVYVHITQDKEISHTSLKHLALYLKEQLLIKAKHLDRITTNNQITSKQE